MNMEIPAAGGALYLRLNGPPQSLFYGQPWISSEVKQWLPSYEKGNPFPVASDSPDAAKQ